MSDRDEFEKRFPVPDGVFWSEDFRQYEAESMEFEPDADLHHEKWQVWQAAREQGGEAVAFISKGNLDYLKRNPSSTVDATLDESIIYGTKPVPLYTHPQPAKVPEGLPLPEVGARHPEVVRWRNNAIEASAKIASAYGYDEVAADIRKLFTVKPPEGAE